VVLGVEVVVVMPKADNTNSLHMSQSRNTLTARSVLLSVLLGTDPPRLPVRLLVRTTELFGIAEGTTRTALSRMAAAGEVEAEDGWYALASDRLLARQARQTASREARTHPWADGFWVQAVVVAAGRRAAADRSALRAALDGARLAELREGVWLRPDNLGDPRPVTGGEVRWLRSIPDGDPAALADRLWDLKRWAARADDLRRGMSELVGPLEAGDRRCLSDGFVLSADVLRHFQADPLLPGELLPSSWPGDALRRDYDRYDAAYRAVLRDWMREQG
jgi:phenylacetic acid degradation operon negative regulatory protein